MGERDDLYGKPRQENQHEQGGERTQPLGARQPQRCASCAGPGHDTTAQIATAADRRASSIGTISW